VSNLLLPVVVILAAILLLIVFPKAVQRLAEHVQSISFPPLKIEFRGPVSSAPPAEMTGNQAVASGVGPARIEPPADDIAALARRDPSAAIAAWHRVEEALHLAMLRVDLLSPGKESFSLSNNHWLRKQDYIDDETWRLVQTLWLATDPYKKRDPSQRPTPDEAIEFDQRAKIIIQRLGEVQIGRLHRTNKSFGEP
jgi:hypothetical protein